MRHASGFRSSSDACTILRCFCVLPHGISSKRETPSSLPRESQVDRVGREGPWHFDTRSAHLLVRQYVYFQLQYLGIQNWEPELRTRIAVTRPPDVFFSSFSSTLFRSHVRVITSCFCCWSVVNKTASQHFRLNYHGYYMKSTGKNCEHPNLKAGNEEGRCLRRLTLTYKWLKLLTHSAVVDMAFRVKPLIYTIKVPHVIQLLLEEVLMLGHKVTFGENKCIKCCQKKKPVDTLYETCAHSFICNPSPTPTPISSPDKFFVLLPVSRNSSRNTIESAILGMRSATIAETPVARIVCPNNGIVSLILAVNHLIRNTPIWV